MGPRRKATAAKSFEHTKDPQPEGRGQRKDADVQTPAKRKAKTTESSVSGFKRLRKLGGIPTTSGTPSKEYNEVEVRNEITEKMVMFKASASVSLHEIFLRQMGKGL